MVYSIILKVQKCKAALVTLCIYTIINIGQEIVVVDLTIQCVVFDTLVGSSYIYNTNILSSFIYC